MKSLKQAIKENTAKRDTPWGRAQHVNSLGKEGIVVASTAGHGGIYVPNELLNRIPEKQRRWAKKWSGSENWYEEDCCWSAVALAFLELFPEVTAEKQKSLQAMIDEYSKDC